MINKCLTGFSRCCKGSWSFASHFAEKQVPRNQFPIGHHVFAVGLALIGIGGIATAVLAIHGVYALATSQTASPAAATPPAPTETCQKFNLDHWQRGQGLLTQDGDTWIVGTSSPNGLLRYDAAIPLNSNVTLKFIPESDSQVNFVITMHDLYEITIGDGSYSGVTVRVATSTLGKLSLYPDITGKRRVYFGDSPMLRGNDVTVVVQQSISRVTTGGYELNLRLGKRSLRGTTDQATYATYSFPLPSKFAFDDLSQSTRFSVGLKAASDKSRVAAEILCASFD